MLPPEFELQCTSTRVVPKFSGLKFDFEKSENFRDLVDGLKYSRCPFDMPVLEDVLSNISENVDAAIDSNDGGIIKIQDVCLLQKRLLEGFEMLNTYSVTCDNEKTAQLMQRALDLTIKQREMFAQCPGIAKPNAIGGVPMEFQEENVERLLEFSKNSFDIDFERSKIESVNRFKDHNASMNVRLARPEFSLDSSEVVEAAVAPSDFILVSFDQ